MNRLLVCHPSRGFLENVAPQEISDLLENPKTLFWLDLLAPTPDEMALLGSEFGFHRLALEDIEHAHQRAKIEQYDTFYFMILYIIALNGAECGIRTDELALFVGRNYLVTVHREPMPVLAEVADRWKAGVREVSTGIAGVLHSLLDSIVDDYFPVVDALGDRIDALEDAIFDNGGQEALQPLFNLKKDLLYLRKVITPERDGMNVLMRRELPIIEPRSVAYFQDVYDHLVRLTDSVDTFRDILSSALDAYLSVVSNRLNEVMKTLTASATILMSLALIAGIYGMNFHYMPELQWRYGYCAVLGLMLVVGGVLGAYFRRKGWF